MERSVKRVMSRAEMDLALARIAGEIVEANSDLDRTVLVGIRRRGVPLARILRDKIAALTGHKLPLGILDITFYRDDLSLVASQPVVRASHLNFDVTGRRVLLVDDVLYTGRTTRAAIDSVIDYGRPEKVELVVLIDRGRRELPIQADYIGQQVETSQDEVVEVRIPPIDNGNGAVYLTTKEFLQLSEDGLG
ncbi:MAG: bifunctional pyr operon transcriptional regulator/uracil phosphoribosyltransferase PyrR [Acidobacteriota bacterium]